MKRSAAGDRFADRVNRLYQRTGFLGGGGPEAFAENGRAQLISLLRQGIHPDSKVLEVGCGCLRAGYWIIHFLNPGCYFAIEPNQGLLQAGVEELFDPAALNQKKPRFDHNTDFDFGVFGTRFDYVVARSIWTHASKEHIQQMLDGFVTHSNDRAVLIASYKGPIPVVRPDYRGSEWVGISHESATPGIVRHSFRWIRRQSEERNLTVSKLKQDNFRNQTWLRVAKRA